MASDDSPPAAAGTIGPGGHITRVARYGIILFVVYLLLYAGFIALAVLRPEQMGAPVLGVNVAIAYGMGLIVAALLLALVYLAITRGMGHQAQPPAEEHP
jgi:uncharacterized membrane protein (DUF485 family)